MMVAQLIAGPTASGKSALALALARAAGGWIVNADSMQVYAGLRLLSARPSAQDEALVPHYLFGHVQDDREYSVGDFIADFTAIRDQAQAAGAPLFVVGGTGLYFKALIEGLTPTPAIPAEIRAHWRKAAAEGWDLFAELRRRDPQRAAQLAPKDVARLLRAIELHDATGIAYSAWLAAHPGVPVLGAGEWRGLFLDPPRAALHGVIDARFRGMIEAGALDEVARLLARLPALGANRGVMKAHGVRHLAAHLRGEITLTEAIALGQGDTRAYARRQRIFARKYLTPPLWQWRSGGENDPTQAPLAAEAG